MTSKSELFMALVIIFIMGGGVFGYALLQQTPQGNQNTVTFPSLIERPLAPEERIAILRSGKTLIEYIYPENCTECPEKAGIYRSFVSSPEYQGYVTLSVAADENITADWIIGRNGDRTELYGLNSSEELADIFCSVALNQPNICMLKEL
ncbi:MAG: hypothetical protein JW754_01305 [Candidatus Aenigmarchaeota archaeon]|nr:hypothetical protein [Candidatus Aenigmarchaeota archaeon]